MDTKSTIQPPPGKARYALVYGDEIRDQRNWSPNTVIYDWGQIVGNLLRGSPDGKNYHIGGLYLEFENNGGAAVTPPTIDRAEGLSYYEGLGGNKDYLRLVGPYTKLYQSGDVWVFSVSINSSGIAGENGNSFSAASSSRVYGAALVAFPDVSDSSQDIVLSRHYPSNTDEQLVKPANAQINVEWELTLN